MSPAGLAENNEPLRVRHLFHRWLAREGVKVIVDLKEINQFGVWEVGLLTSFKREVDQRAGVLRLCHLNPSRSGYFQNDRFAGQFDIYGDTERAAHVRLCNSAPPRIGLAHVSCRFIGAGIRVFSNREQSHDQRARPDIAPTGAQSMRGAGAKSYGLSP